MNKFVFAILVIVTTSLMGSSFTIGKMALAYSTPLLLVGLRFLLAGLIMATIVKLLKRPHPTLGRDWLRMAIIGFAQTTGVMGCTFVGLRTITAGEISILTFTNPLLVIILTTIFLKSRYRSRQWIGVVIGFIGVFLTLGAHLDLKFGTMLGLLAAVSWAIGTLLIKKWGGSLDIWVLTAYQMFFGGVALLLLSIVLETPAFAINLQSVLLLTWLAIMASIVQFAGWFFLLQKGDPGKVSAFLFLAPFFGVLSGWFLLDEQISWYVIVGGLLIFVGIFLVNWQSKPVKAGEVSIES
ncbi:DMT family transporter [Bacillus suaedae]|uniref:DMT family transporter n=1 Tax=Halalkalibacter suaedae TaxID=2822140 RepID=A0A941API7_9BACI|nr:DMT family transporter [Bacillus suaedae]MBP3950158.1 DMT family transporter [Bacillus suaedae]